MSNLSETEIRALEEALDDEYKALATYDQIIADFGEVRPFINIREAEARHIEALYALFAHYGITVPENPWTGKVNRYPDLKTACEAGVAAEIANTAIYQRLTQATQRPDILAVFRNLRDASQLHHLPAFQRCAQGAGDGTRRQAGGYLRRQGRRRGGHKTN
ncbi:ferritin-like domain-containing protein [Methylomonas sp. MgM2]